MENELRLITSQCLLDIFLHIYTKFIVLFDKKGGQIFFSRDLTNLKILCVHKDHGIIDNDLLTT